MVCIEIFLVEFDEEFCADALAECRQFLSEKFAVGAFEALAGDAGAGGAAEDRTFGGAVVISVEAGDGEGLENVEFDEFHDIVLG